jgi:hypothetical protein
VLVPAPIFAQPAIRFYPGSRVTVPVLSGSESYSGISTIGQASPRTLSNCLFSTLYHTAFPARPYRDQGMYCCRFCAHYFRC